MKRFRNFGFALWLVLALLVGQQAAALHELGHATAEFKQDKGSPGSSSKCDKHFLFAQFSGAVGPLCPVPPVSAGDVVEALVHQAFAPTAARFAFQSRAPPAIS
jgi:FtsP/CotA-like multicopper oxidase with cupredoxin domain